MRFSLRQADSRYWERVFGGLRIKRRVPRTGFAIAQVVGNLGGENKGTDGVGRAVLAYEKAFDLLAGLAYSHGIRYRCL